MSRINITDEQLVDYVDGNTDDLLTKEIEDALTISESIKKKIDSIRKTNQLLNQVSKELKNEALPQDIQNLVEVHRKNEELNTNQVKVSRLSYIFQRLSSIQAPRVAMIAASVLFGAYAGLNFQNDDVLNGNNEIGEYSNITLRGDDNSLDDILLTILRERRKLSIVKDSDINYQVKLIKTFKNANNQSCELGEIINLENKSSYFIACSQDLESYTISYIK